MSAIVLKAPHSKVRRKSYFAGPSRDCHIREPELYRLVRGRQLSEELVRKLVREIGLLEARLISI